MLQLADKVNDHLEWIYLTKTLHEDLHALFILIQQVFIGEDISSSKIFREK
jgi:hypothetical protein